MDYIGIYILILQINLNIKQHEILVLHRSNWDNYI